MTAPARSGRGPVAVALLLLALAGCAVGPDFVPPVPPQPAGYTAQPLPSATAAADGTAQRFLVGAELASGWWHRFGSPQLDHLVAAATAGNLNLQAARARLRQSRELLQAGYGVFLPRLDAGLAFSRERASASRFGGGFPASIYDLYSATLKASFRPDLFGANRRQVEGLAADVDLQEAQLQATRLALLGNLVQTAIARSAYQARIEVSEQQVALLREQVDIAETQLQAGLVGESQVYLLRGELADTEAGIPALRRQRDAAEHLLALLSGQLPAAITLPLAALEDLHLPAELPLSLPSRLVQRRPDIRAAQARLHRASAEIGVASAALYPDLTLDAGFGRESAAASGLSAGSSTIWHWSAELLQPLFRGGSLRHRRQAAVAAFEAARSDYRQTVLAGFVEVADALRALQEDALELRSRSAGLASARSNLKLLQANHRAGLASYLEVLVADRQYLQARSGLIGARARRLQDTVVLFTALGGGLPPIADPTAPAPPDAGL